MSERWTVGRERPYSTGVESAIQTSSSQKSLSAARSRITCLTSGLSSIFTYSAVSRVSKVASTAGPPGLAVGLATPILGTLARYGRERHTVSSGCRAAFAVAARGTDAKRLSASVTLWLRTRRRCMTASAGGPADSGPALGGAFRRVAGGERGCWQRVLRAPGPAGRGGGAVGGDAGAAAGGRGCGGARGGRGAALRRWGFRRRDGRAYAASLARPGLGLANALAHGRASLAVR